MLKQANLSFSVAAQSYGDDVTSIQFSTQDKNTAKLIFVIKEGKVPLNLTDIEGKVDLVMGDKSIFDDNRVEVTAPLDGKLEYTITPEQIRHPGRARGELQLTSKDGQSIGGFRFNFTVKKALVDEMAGPVKEYYVQDLEAIKAEIQKTAESIKNIDVVRIDTKLNELEEQIGEGVGVDEQARQKIEEVTEQLADEAKQKTLLTQSTIKPLFINSFDGAMDALHPTICYVPNGINGYRYWMAYTPLTAKPPYQDRWECPSIAHSVDGVDWKTPSGLTNPIDDLTNEEITAKGYFSDPTMIYNPTTGQLELFYRYSVTGNNTRTMIYRKTSTNGVNWSSRVLVYDSTVKPSLAPNTSEIVSPQIIYQNGKYRMYYKFNPGVNGKTIRYAETTDSTNWDVRPVDCDLTGFPSGRNAIWHMGVYFDTSDNAYHMLAFEDPSGANAEILYCKATDGINFKYQGLAIGRSERVGYKTKGLYQAHMTKVNGEWLVYATVKIKYNLRNDGEYAARSMISLFTGDNLLNLVPADGGARNTREVFLNDVLLANSDKPNANKLRYLVYENEDRTKSVGFGVNTDNKAPSVIFQDGNNWDTQAVPSIKNRNKNPDIPPDFPGQLWRNWSTLFYGYGTTASDWMRIGTVNFDGTLTQPGITNTRKVVNNSVTGMAADTVIDGNNRYMLVLTSAVNPVSNISNAVEGQEFVIINAVPGGATNVTLKHVGNANEGRFYLRGQTDRILKPQEAIKLIKYAAYFVEI